MRVAIITGGAAGMGFAVAQELVKNDWRVALFDVNDETGSPAVASLGEGRSQFHRVDVTNYEQQQLAFEAIHREYGSIDFVYANAGIAGKADFYDEPEQWPPSAPSMLVEDINFKGAAYTSHLAM
jgi:15-hydroxyprostaglandin dehydrogenase (NAD)